MFTVLKSIVCYALGVLGFFLFWHWFFDKPNEHDILIPLLTGFGASSVACGIIDDEHIQDKNVEFAHYVIVGVVTAGFWVYQFVDTYNDFQGLKDSNAIISGIATVIYSWSDLLMAAVTFFCIVICNTPPNFSFDRLKGDVSDILDSPQPQPSEKPELDILESLKENYRNDVIEANRAIESNPNDDEAYYKRGCAYNHLGQYDKAIQDLDKFIALNPDFADAYFWRGSSYESLKQYGQAIQDFDKAIELNPNEGTAYSSRGKTYFELGKYALAIQDFDKAIQLDSSDSYSNSFTYRDRGIAYSRLGKYKLAIVDLTKAIELDSENIFADSLYYERGLCYQAIGDDLSAQTDFEKAKAFGHDS